MKYLFLLMLFPVHNIALANDDCPREIPFPVANSKSNKISNYKLLKKEVRYIIESFVLLPDQKIEIHQYGCAHFGLEYRFILNDSNMKNPLKFSRDNLGVLTGVIPDFTPGILKALNSVKTAKLGNSSNNKIIPVTKFYCIY